MQQVLVVAAVLVSLQHSSGWIVCPQFCVCEARGKVDCSRLSLHQMPNYLPAHVEQLKLSENRLQDLPEQLYVPQMLQVLDLSRNLLQSLPEKALGELWLLRRLDLSENRLHRIGDVAPAVHKLHRLTSLHLRSNPLGRIDGHCHHNSAAVGTNSIVLRSESLAELNVADCGLSQVDRCAFVGLTNLTKLTLSDNPLEQFNGIVSPTLRHLDISNCRLTVVASDAFLHTPALLYVNISKNPSVNFFTNNKYIDESASIKYMSTSVVNLDASGCSLMNIPATVFPSLQRISIQSNIVRELQPRIFQGARHLVDIDLSRNLLTEIGDSAFIGAESLTNLNLSKNFINSVNAAALLQMVDLAHLDLSYNPLRYLTNISAPAMIRLILNHCLIENLPNVLPQTMQLDVSNNPIGALPERLYSFHVRKLDLSYCRISKIQSTTFEGLIVLEELDLRGNRLTVPFNFGVLSSLRQVKYLSVTDNPWQCVCDRTITGVTSIAEFFRFIITLSLKTSMESTNSNQNKNLFSSDNSRDNSFETPDRGLDSARLVEIEKHLKCRPINSYEEVLWSQACQIPTTTEKPRRKSPERQWMAFIVTFAVVSSILIVLLVLRQNLIEESRLRRRAQEENSNNNGDGQGGVASTAVAEDAPLTVRPVRSPIADILQLPTYEEAILLPKPIPDDFGVDSHTTREAATWTSHENSINGDNDDDGQEFTEENYCSNLNHNSVSTTSL